jgi:5-methylcytosine-specific restriction endonuclease McrA
MASEATRKEKYREYLESPEWQKRRKQALDHAEHRCQVCNSSKRLDVHHRTYERVERERPRDLTVLCRRCHEMFHGKGKVQLGESKRPKKRKQSQNQKKRAARQRRNARQWAQRPSTSERRQQLAAATLREQGDLR